MKAGPGGMEGAEGARDSPSFPLDTASNELLLLSPEFHLAIRGTHSRSHRSPLFLHKLQILDFYEVQRLLYGAGRCSVVHMGMW